MMTYQEFLEHIINEGIEAVRADYQGPSDKQKLDGSIAGFEACRDKDIEQLSILLYEARGRTIESMRVDSDDYWYWRCYELEIEWACNCVSAMLLNQGRPTIITPTARGVMKAAEILGSKT